LWITHQKKPSKNPSQGPCRPPAHPLKSTAKDQHHCNFLVYRTKKPSLRSSPAARDKGTFKTASLSQFKPCKTLLKGFSINADISKENSLKRFSRPQKIEAFTNRLPIATVLCL